MNWDGLGNSVVGGILGGGVTGTVAWLRFRADRRQAREDRQYQDAEIVAEARQLLIDVLPERRGFNMSPDPAAEGKTWATLNERMQQISRRLLWLAAGRQSPAVTLRASKLSSALHRAVTATEWHIRDLQAHRDPLPTLERAQAAHGEAEALTGQLEQAIKDAGR